MKNIWNKYKTIIQSVFGILALIFIFKYLFDNKEILLSFEWNFNLKYLVFFIFSMCVEQYLGLLSILKLIKIHQLNFEQKKVINGYLRSKFYSYIPGGVWNHIGMGVAIKKAGLKTKDVFSILMLNIGLIAWVAFSFLFFIIPSNYQLFFFLIYIIISIFIPNIIDLYNKILNYFHLDKFLLKKISLRNLAYISMLNFLFWLFIGLNFFFLTISITNLTNILDNPLKIIASYNISWLAGFLFLPAPAGIGVRETVLSYFLGADNIVAVLAVSLSILFRLATLIRDVIFYILWQYFKSKKIFINRFLN